jgi:hypothetical protein
VFPQVKLEQGRILSLSRQTLEIAPGVFTQTLEDYFDWLETVR